MSFVLPINSLKPDERLDYIKKLRDEIYQWYGNKGFRRTQFGWLHHTWIDEGIQVGAIQIPDKYHPNEIQVVFKKTEYEEDTYVGKKRKKKTTVIYDTTAFDKWIRKVENLRKTENVFFKFPVRLERKIEYVFGKRDFVS